MILLLLAVLVTRVDAQLPIQNLNPVQIQPPPSNCIRDVDEDVCPQREGFDDDCDRKCLQNFPMRVGSGCHLRNTGTLLSFFGIRSFMCKCELPGFVCSAPAAAIPFIHPFRTNLVQQHSRLTLLPATSMPCNAPKYEKRLACRERFDDAECGWQRSSNVQWAHATPTGAPMPFPRFESPNGAYLAVTTTSPSADWATLSTCESLCSKGTVNVTVRVWRPVHVIVELCFREQETLLCAPVRTGNGRMVNEVIPETENFQVSLKFSNLTVDDVVMVDDLTAIYDACPPLQSSVSGIAQPQKMESDSAHHEHDELETEPKIQTTTEISKAFPSAPLAVPIPQVSGSASPPQRASSVLVQPKLHIEKKISSTSRRNCVGDDCHSHLGSHYASHAVTAEICRGRAGLLLCRAHCRVSDGAGYAARCIREGEPPFSKKCVCQLRRSPTKKLDQGKAPLTKRRKVVDAASSRMTMVDQNTHMRSSLPNPSRKIFGEEIYVKKLVRETCERPGENETCDNICKANDSESRGTCEDDGNCSCRHCRTSLCNFERNTRCGWSDLRMLSTQFNNISVAMKRGDENRYGLTRLRPMSYSGLVHRQPLNGPIVLSVDAFPSHAIDVRICVQNLRKCQTQRIAAKSWNRVTAKIKVPSAEKVFIVFQNRDLVGKAVAIDNILIRGGDC
ncbi:unnamed protein product [Caenorhabditis auriculariae]|uniref:MAM domain-containing protein n=1 Tax=Caenorhabditis auriculariae TaxID=2777116 RepID=A0A8S1H6Q1_9PELO|nr:unnamed protein product [Caenorhabditis auriculariae]